MQIIQKILSFSFLILLINLSACSAVFSAEYAVASTDTETNVKTDSKAAEKIDEKINEKNKPVTELRFWNFWNPKFILPVIEAFESQNPGIKIVNEQLNWGNGLDKIVVSLANGQAPDICELGSTWTGKFMAAGAVLDLTEELRSLENDYLMWEPATWKNKIYGMPWLVGTRILFFNKSLFKSAGLNPDAPPETWAELLDAAEKLHNPAQGKYGFGINAGEGHILYKKFLPFVWGNGGTILDENQSWAFKGKEVTEAFEFYRKLASFGMKEKQDLLDEAFMKGKLGMEISGSWNFAKFPKEAPDLDFGVSIIPKPSREKGKSTSFLGGEILVLFNKCKNKEAAVKFIKFLTLAENTLPITKEALVSFPANKKAFSDSFFTENKKLAVFVKQMETGIHPPVNPLWVDAESIINDAVEKIIYGQNIEKILVEAEKSYNQVSERFSSREKERAENIEKRNGESRDASQTHFPLKYTWIISLIAIGILVNTILSFLILRELKKKDRIT
ncbi:MAG: extracellular solute-binding protein [Candidatus Riflebacteria bacterium]|nr:extracellular solute-binding protein [Candidatus Riflebacteria bacterium]